MRFLRDQEQGQTPYQLVFARNDRPGEMMMAANRDRAAEITEVRNEREQRMMTGTVVIDIVQEVQSKMDVGITMGIEAGSQATINIENHGESGDGHDHGQWTQGGAEMRNDVEWIDTHSISLGFPVLARCMDY